MLNYEVSNGINFLTFVGGNRLNIKDSGCKLGFFGYGRSDFVQYDNWQDSTFLVDNYERPILELPWNTKYYCDESGYLTNLSSPIKLSAIPNYQSVINIRFLTDDVVKIMEAKVKLYDGNNIDNPPKGVKAKIAEIYHPGRKQIENRWNFEEWHSAGSGQYIYLWRNPGEDGQYSGLYQHKRSSINDWFLVLSVSPIDHINATRNFGSLYCYIEYL